MDTKLEKLFELNFVNNLCCCDTFCWGDKIKGVKDYATIYRPFIGKEYEKNKLLCLGINFNDYGCSYDALIDLMKETKTELLRGKKQLFNNEEYKGSIVYHRMLAYANLWLNSEISDNNLINWDFPSVEMANVLDKIAFTNMIKCSPATENSKPLDSMWHHCPSTYLKKEIEILKPRKILLMGNSDNLNAFKKITDCGLSLVESVNSECFLYSGSINGEKFELMVVPHPSFAGRKQTIYDHVADLIMHNDIIGQLKIALKSSDPNYSINSFRQRNFVEVFYRPYFYWVEIWVFESRYCEVWLANYGKDGIGLTETLTKLGFVHNGSPANYENKIYYHIPQLRFEKQQWDEMLLLVNELMKIIKNERVI